MWNQGWRDRIWSQFDTKFDLIIIGGGITGAGVLREAARAGYNALLVEANDFASGTSSRSSKLVHGGLRYLKNFQFKTTLQSVAERQNLLTHGKGLVNQLDILFASYSGNHTPPWQMGLGLAIYGIMANKWQYNKLSASEIKKQIPFINSENLLGAFPYYDAQTDDARLTLRVLQEAVQAGGKAVNYTKAISLLRNNQHQVNGIGVIDQSDTTARRTAEISAHLIINATGAWADTLRSELGLESRIRPLRGSHLIVSQKRLPLPCSMSINHPLDQRPVFAFPWEGVTLVGTTDIDINGTIPKEPKISPLEYDYLLEFIQFAFPDLKLTADDVISTWAGIRPVINTGKTNPSKESRDHAIWYEDGLLTITGGKLTTFRVMAQDVMNIARKFLPIRHPITKNFPILENCPSTKAELASNISPNTHIRLYGRYATFTSKLLENLSDVDAAKIEDTPYIWREIDWAAQNEGIIHLDDLLLRRVRIGLLLPDGAINLLPIIKPSVQQSLGWSDKKWHEEVEAYKNIIKSSYSA